MSVATDKVSGQETPCEALSAPQWCRLLSRAPQTFRDRCLPSGAQEASGLQLFAFDALPADYRAELEKLRLDHATPNFSALLARMDAAALGWQPPKPWAKYKPSVRQRATVKRDALAVWYAARRNKKSKKEAWELVRAEFDRITGKTVGARQVRRWIETIEARGGEFAPLAAYCDEKEVPHIAARLTPPEELIVALQSKVHEPGVGEWSAAVRHFQLAWVAGADVPGLGRAQAGEPFPFTAKQLQKFCPSKAARVHGSRGKFAAKAVGLLPAPPISRRNVRLRERIVFDDKRLDIVALDDATGLPVTLVGCFMMDEATSQILGYILRPDGGLRQNDVEGLTAFFLRVVGFAGTRAGYATTLKFERGQVAISPDREALIYGMFPGQFIVSRTSMIGGHGPGGFKAEPSGNFFGKGRLESFYRTFDHYFRHVRGQRGNVHSTTPLMLGDLLTTPEKIAHQNYKLKGTMIEEAVLCGQAAMQMHWRETGEVNSIAAVEATGIVLPLLHTREIHAALQAAILFYNAERGHRREGFNDIAVTTADGGVRWVTESANDKAARLHAELAAQGRCLTTISAADATVLLHRCKRVTVKPSGARVRIDRQERVYWHPDSLAVAAAQRSSLGEKVFLALFNPDDPRELYLLHNAPGSFPPAAAELPSGQEPHFFEALPLYEAPDANDEAALARRAKSVAANVGRVMVELQRNVIPFDAEQTARRERNLEITKPMREAVTVLREQMVKGEQPATAVGEAFAASDRTEARRRYEESLIQSKAARAQEFDER